MKRSHLAGNLFVLLLLTGAAGVGAFSACDMAEAKDTSSRDQAGLTVLKGTVPGQWRIVWTHDPATEAVISWTTAVKPQNATLHYDTETRSGVLPKYAKTAKPDEAGVYTDKKIKLHYHHAKLTGLQPDTLYWFTIACDAEATRELHFRTAPAGDVEFKFLYGGDSRTNRGGRQAMNKRMRALLEADPAILCLVHGGDYVTDGDEMDEWVEWLSDHELTTTEAGRVLPVVPARGNHEATGPQYDEIFCTPGGVDKNYYTTRFGSQFIMINLNTEISAGGDQAVFLEDALAANTSVRWQCANYHRPAYPAVKKPGAALQHWVPLFEQYNLDVAFESDGHTLKRTCAIRGGKADATGVVYIGEGGLGVKQRTPDDERWYFRGGMTASANHVQKVSVTGTELKVESIAEDGRVLDTWAGSPRKRK